jgi:hypothetical protein
MIFQNIEETHALVIGGLNNPGYLYADDLVVAYFTTRRLQKKIYLVNSVHKYCRRYNLRYSLNRSKVADLANLGKLKETGTWRMTDRISSWYTSYLRVFSCVYVQHVGKDKKKMHSEIKKTGHF